MGKEEQLLSTSIRDSIHEANQVVTKISHLAEGYNSENIDEPDPAMEEADEMLEFYLTKLYRDAAMLAERLQMPLLARRIAAEFDRITDFGKMETSSFEVGLVSPHLDRVKGHFGSLSTLTEGTEVTGLDVFRTILENTPAIIELTKADPRKESDVQREVMKVLKIAFPEAEREPSISHVFKSYKPDFGVRSLMAAAEYKFAATRAEVRGSLDGIYTDMKGYSGHYDWRTFYAVIYTTDTLVNPREIEAEFRGVNADTNWSPIVVVGKGDRKPAKRRAGGSAGVS